MPTRPNVMSTERSKGEWSRLARQQAAVARAGQMGLGGGDFGDLLAEFVASVSNGIDADAVTLFELAPDALSFTIRAVVVEDRTVVGPAVGGVRIPAGVESLPGFAIEVDELVEAVDLLTDGRFRARAPEFDMRSLSGMAVPIGWGPRHWGVLAAYTDERRLWSADDRNFLQSMANTLSLTLYRQQAELALAENASRMSLLAQLGSVLMESLQPEVVISKLAEICVEHIADGCFVDLLDGSGRFVESVVVAVDDDLRASIVEVREGLSRAGDEHAARGLFGERGVALDGAHRLVSVARSTGHDGLERLGVHSAVAVPLVARAHIAGVAVLLRVEPSWAPFDEHDVTLVQEMADRAGLAYDNAGLFRANHRVARALQQVLLPPALPDVDGLDLAADYRVADDDSDIGGDFYDVIEMGRDRWGIVIGDVCGRGPEAAALTGLLRHSIRASVAREHVPSRVLAQVNDAVLEQIDPSRFCTATFLRVEVDPSAAVARVVGANAGHPPPIVIRAGGEVELVRSRGLVVGVVPSPVLEDFEVDLARGDAMVLYTDGLTEARNGGEQLGEGGLVAILERFAGEGATTIVDAAMVEVERYADGVGDDRAMVVVRVTGPGAN